MDGKLNLKQNTIIQQNLQKLGWFPETREVTGYWTPVAVQAWRAYNRNKGALNWKTLPAPIFIVQVPEELMESEENDEVIAQRNDALAEDDNSVETVTEDELLSMVAAQNEAEEELPSEEPTEEESENENSDVEDDTAAAEDDEVEQVEEVVEAPKPKSKKKR